MTAPLPGISKKELGTLLALGRRLRPLGDLPPFIKDAIESGSEDTKETVRAVLSHEDVGREGTRPNISEEIFAKIHGFANTHDTTLCSTIGAYAKGGINLLASFLPRPPAKATLAEIESAEMKLQLAMGSRRPTVGFPTLQELKDRLYCMKHLLDSLKDLPREERAKCSVAITIINARLFETIPHFVGKTPVKEFLYNDFVGDSFQKDYERLEEAYGNQRTDFLPRGNVAFLRALAEVAPHMRAHVFPVGIRKEIFKLGPLIMKFIIEKEYDVLARLYDSDHLRKIVEHWADDIGLPPAKAFWCIRQLTSPKFLAHLDEVVVAIFADAPEGTSPRVRKLFFTAYLLMFITGKSREGITGETIDSALLHPSRARLRRELLDYSSYICRFLRHIFEDAKLKPDQLEYLMPCLKNLASGISWYPALLCREKPLIHEFLRIFRTHFDSDPFSGTTFTSSIADVFTRFGFELYVDSSPPKEEILAVYETCVVNLFLYFETLHLKTGDQAHTTHEIKKTVAAIDTLNPFVSTEDVRSIKEKLTRSARLMFSEDTTIPSESTHTIIVGALSHVTGTEGADMRGAGGSGEG